MKKKLIALLLLFGLCLGCFQMTAFADDAAAAAEAVEDEEVDPVLEEHQAFLDELKALQEAKKYDEVIEQAEDFLSDNEDSPLYGPIEKVCIQSYVRKARVLIDNKQREKAQDLLEECADYYEDSDYLYIVEKEQQALKDLLKKEIPKTGKIFHDRSSIRGGYSKLIVKNSARKTLVKIQSASGKNKGEYITMFLRSNGKGEVNLQPGKYYIKFARGDTWYSSKEMFGSETSYFQPEGTYEFKPGYYWEITLDEGTEYLPGIDADDF